MRDILSSLLFTIAMMPLNYIFRNAPGATNFKKSLEKINHFMYMNDTKLFCKNENELETETKNKNIQPVYRNGF